jgi:hypothetical protein
VLRPEERPEPLKVAAAGYTTVHLRARKAGAGDWLRRPRRVPWHRRLWLPVAASESLAET